jgi:hypothetical protein
MTTKVASYTPNEATLEYLQNILKEMAQTQEAKKGGKQGVVAFTSKDLQVIFDKDKKVSSSVRRSNLPLTMNWLERQGYVTRMEIGRTHKPSVWNVQKFIELESASSPLDRPVSTESTPPKFEVSVVKDSKEKKENKEVLTELNQTIGNMMQFLQALPNEMTAELKNISKDLTYADHNIVLELTKEKEDLKDEVSRLKEQLERASATPDYSEHYIYRQRNLIVDEVQRMLHAPAWSVKQNKEHYQKSVIEKLDNIMSHLGIKENTSN